MMHSAELEEAVVISGPRKGAIITVPLETVSDAGLPPEGKINFAQCVKLARHVAEDTKAARQQAEAMLVEMREARKERREFLESIR